MKIKLTIFLCLLSFLLTAQPTSFHDLFLVFKYYYNGKPLQKKELKNQGGLVGNDTSHIIFSRITIGNIPVMGNDFNNEGKEMTISFQSGDSIYIDSLYCEEGYFGYEYIPSTKPLIWNGGKFKRAKLIKFPEATFFVQPTKANWWNKKKINTDSLFVGKKINQYEKNGQPIGWWATFWPDSSIASFGQWEQNTKWIIFRFEEVCPYEWSRPPCPQKFRFFKKINRTRMTGEWKSWDKYGNLYETTIWEDGKRIKTTTH